MPGVKRCQKDGNPGWQAKSENAKCYTYGEGTDRSEDEAKRKAHIQDYAIQQSEGES